MLTINNTLDGYLKDVEIKGNTIQDSENLADIRSVGDKVEGQELYEIPVLSCGENLFDLSKLSGGEFTTLNGKNVYKYIDNASFYFYNGKFKKDTQYTITMTMFRDVGYEVKGLNLEIVYTDGTSKNFSLTHGVIRTITSEKGKTIEKLSGSYNHGLTAYIDLDSICLNEGDVAINYQPYVEDKLTILSPVQLEKVGDVADRIIEKDGVCGAEKNVYNEVFTIDDISAVTFLDNVARYVFRPRTGLVLNRNAISNYTSNFYIDFAYDGESWYETGGTVVVKRNKATVGDTEEKAKEYLKNNPIVFLNTTTQPQFIPLPHDQQVKLRTFANKTNISFLTEIEGTIKAQVPKSIGATVNTHTEQINNLNKELDRVKKLEESTVSTVTTESDFATVEATSNGYFEDVKLEGKTLVNLATQPTNNGSINHQYATISTVTNIKPSTVYTYIIRNNGSETLKLYLNTNGGFDWFDLDVEANSTVIGKARTLPTIDGDIWLSLSEAETIEQNLQVVLLEGDHTQNPPSYFEGLKSVGEDVDEIVVSSNNNQPKQIETTDDNSITTTIDNPNYQSDKKRLLYYNNETQTWEKPILREWDSIEKHADGKYYYHQRSGEVVLNGSENWGLNAGWSGEEMSTNSYYLTADGQKTAGLMIKSNGATNIISEVMPTVFINSTSFDSDCVSGENYSSAIYIRINKSKVLNGIKPYLQQNPMRVVYQLAEEKVYECTNIDLITYANETNYIVECGAISPKTTLKVHNNISNVVSLLQKKVSLLENNITSYMITQNRLMLASRYNADTVSFKVDVATLRNSFEYDNDLYELILNNILVGKDNYNREYIENLIIFYWMDFVISDEMYSTLFEIIEEQHNPKIEEETPLI